MTYFSKELLDRLCYVDSEEDLLEAIRLDKYPIADTLPEFRSVSRDKLVALSHSDYYPGSVLVSSEDRLLSQNYSEWMSRYSLLNDLFVLETFVRKLVSDGYYPLLHTNTVPLLEDSIRWSRPLEIKGFQLPNSGQLYRYQNYTLNRALERAQSTNPKERFFFFNWGTGCLSSSTYLQTEYGLKQIKDLVCSEQPVGSWTEENFLVASRGGPQKCTGVLHKGVEEGYRLGLHIGTSLTATKTHRFLSPTSLGLEWVEVDSLTVGDTLLVPRVEGLFGSRQVDPKIARLLGWIIAEGSMDRTQKHSCVSITQFRVGADKTDPDGNDDIRELCEHFTGLPYELHPEEYQLSSKFGRVLVEEYGLVPSHSGDKTVPSSILEGTQEVVREFLRGYFEGDGEAGHDLRCSSASRQLIEEIQQLLLLFGISSSIRVFESCATNTREKIGRVYYQLNIFDRVKFEDQINFVSRRKREILKEYNLRKSRGQTNSVDVLGRRQSTSYTSTDRVPHSTQWAWSVLNYLNQRVPLEERRSWSKTLRTHNKTQCYQHLWSSCAEWESFSTNTRRDTRGLTTRGIKHFVEEMSVYSEHLKENQLWNSLVECVDSCYLATRITSKEECYEDFWDLSVDTTEAYIASGVVSHNCGKSAICVAGAQELFNRNEIDLVLAFTKGSLKADLQNFFQTTSQLNAVINEGKGNKTVRHKNYFDSDTQVFVLNYEKAHWDFDPLSELVKTQRVLWIFDEVQAILTESSRNSYRKGLDKLISQSQASIVWPMSASIVNGSPLRFRDCFQLTQTPGNLLGTKQYFQERYKKSISRFRIKTKRGGYFWQETVNWDEDKLHEIRHRVSSHTQTIRKTDPEVRDNFKTTTTEVLHVELSKEDRKVYDYIKDLATEAHENEESLMPYYRLLRIACNTTEGFLHTEDSLADLVVSKYNSILDSKYSSKMEMFLDQIESMQDAGEKVVAFTQWTNLSLFRIEQYLQKRGITYRTHHGGQSESVRQQSKLEFKNNSDVTLFLSSDAGAYGLNLPESRYVVNYDCPYSYDILMQRNDRINRADSYLDGLTSYIYVTKDTIEERVFAEMNRRKKIAANTSGTREVLNYSETGDDTGSLTRETLTRLIFGDSETVSH